MTNPEANPHRSELNGPKEACGITALFSKKNNVVSHLIPRLQKELQHRGKDSAGVSFFVDGNIEVHAGQGKVDDVFPVGFNYPNSDRGIGHNRYGTSGESEKDSIAGSQPITGEWNNRKISIAYNGNLPQEMRNLLQSRLPEEMKGSTFDTQDIANAIVSADGDDWVDKIKNGLKGISMAYSLTMLTDDGRIFGLRGPSGTWPLWYGETSDEIIFSSETRVKKDGEIKWLEAIPGDLLEATKDGIERRRIFEETDPLFRCALHDVYGAKEDSRMFDGIQFSKFRKELGKQLAREFSSKDIDLDLIVGVPATGLVIAEGFAEELGRNTTNLFEINKNNKESEDRSFIAPDLDKTSDIVHNKFSIPNPELAKDKKVMLIDDSVIRGRTMKGDPEKGKRGIIDFVRATGASEVHVAVILPKFVAGCDMGYYIRKDQLVALVRDENGRYQERSEKEIAEMIGADSTTFLSNDGLKGTYEKVMGQKEVACTACMGGEHPLDILKNRHEEAKEEKVIFSA